MNSRRDFFGSVLYAIVGSAMSLICGCKIKGRPSPPSSNIQIFVDGVTVSGEQKRFFLKRHAKVNADGTEQIALYTTANSEFYWIRFLSPSSVLPMSEKPYFGETMWLVEDFK
jgi:hypothetical protein